MPLLVWRVRTGHRALQCGSSHLRSSSMPSCSGILYVWLQGLGFACRDWPQPTERKTPACNTKVQPNVPDAKPEPLRTTYLFVARRHSVLSIRWLFELPACDTAWIFRSTNWTVCALIHAAVPWPGSARSTVFVMPITSPESPRLSVFSWLWLQSTRQKTGRNSGL